MRMRGGEADMGSLGGGRTPSGLCVLVIVDAAGSGVSSWWDLALVGRSFLRADMADRCGV